MSAEPEYVVGIDLGTTHSALACAKIGFEGARPSVLRIPQLTGPGEVSSLELRPSFIYFAQQSEGAQALPWDAERRYAVGDYARQRGSDAPERGVIGR